MRSRVLIASTAVIALTAAASAVGAGQAGGHGSDPDGHGSAGTRFTVVERATSDKYIDNKPKGDSLGDMIVFGNSVYDKTNTKKVGRDQGFCIRTVVGKGWECSFTTLLANGSLTVQGPFYDRRPSVLAITGGTGAYSRARGEMHLRAANKEGSAFAFTFDVQY
jgi:hypothetical protein